MPRFLAVYTMRAENVARFPKAEQDAVDAAGIKQWMEWEKDRRAD